MNKPREKIGNLRCYLRQLDKEWFSSQKKLRIDGTHPPLCFEGGINLGGCQRVSLEEKTKACDLTFTVCPCLNFVL